MKILEMLCSDQREGLFTSCSALAFKERREVRPNKINICFAWFGYIFEHNLAVQVYPGFCLLRKTDFFA